MKKSMVFVLVGLLLLPACKGVDTSEWKVYSNERYGFEVSYPEDLEEHVLEVGLSDTLYQLSFMTPGACEDCELIEDTDSPADKLELNVFYGSVEDYLATVMEGSHKEVEVGELSVWLSEPWIGLQADVREALIPLSEDRTLQIFTQGERMNELLPEMVETFRDL